MLQKKPATTFVILAGLAIIILAVFSYCIPPGTIHKNLTIADVHFDIHYPRSITWEKTESIDIKVRNLNYFSVRAGIIFATEPTPGLYFLLPDSKRRRSDAIHWHDLDRLQPFSHVNVEIPFVFEGDLSSDTASFSLRFTVIQNGLSKDSIVDFHIAVGK